MSDLIRSLLLLQLALPLGLILANGLLPFASRLGFVLRSLAIAGLLIYLALAGLWLFPPFWTPHALGLLHVALCFWRYHRQRQGGASPRRAFRFGELALSLAALGGALALLVPVIDGRRAPDLAIDLAQPLGPGRYLVVSGGATLAVNAHLRTLDLPRAADFRGQSYAVDIIGIDRIGRRSSGIQPPDPSAYVIQGRPVLAPCAGQVIGLTSGVPDNTVPDMTRDPMTGNSVILDCDGLAVVLAHFRPGSLRVAPGEQVSPGQPLAEVGNSGNSGEPHLHLHVQTLADPARPLSGAPLFFSVEGDFLRRNDRLFVKGALEGQ